MRLRHVDRRQTHGGQYPTRNLEAFSCIISPRAGGQSISKAVSIPSVVHSARDGMGFITVALLPMCLPSPSVFAYCKRSNTGGGNSLGTRLGYISIGGTFLCVCAIHGCMVYIIPRKLCIGTLQQQFSTDVTQRRCICVSVTTYYTDLGSKYWVQ